MAEKFANFRWVKEGYLDNRLEGHVVGRIEFAAIGPLDLCLTGDFKPDIAGKVIRFTNSKFVNDPSAAQRLADMASPHLGKVSLISFDPHPLLAPHPYIEWFSEDEDHYRIELESDEGWVVEGQEAEALHEDSLRIYRASAKSPAPVQERVRNDDQEWF